MAHTSLNILAVPPEPSLFAYTKYGIQATNTSGNIIIIIIIIIISFRVSDKLKVSHSLTSGGTFVVYIVHPMCSGG